MFFTVCPGKDANDAVLFKKMLDKDWIYDFLAGLNKELDEIRGRILGIHLLPPSDEVSSEV